MSLAQVQAKRKLAQNRTAEELSRLLENMWRRGLPSDPHAIELVRAANDEKVRQHLPPFLASPVAGLKMSVDVDHKYVDEAAALLAPLYWNVGLSRETIVKAHLGSAAWVGATDETGALVASARAISDGAKWACVFDVVVRDDLRGQGVGTAVVRLLLDHPRVRGTRKVLLATRDAQAMYAKLGFVEKTMSKYTEMTLERPLA